MTELTPEEIDDLLVLHGKGDDGFHSFALAVIAAHEAKQAVKPIPTKMTIAPRGMSWHGDELRNGLDGAAVRSDAAFDAPILYQHSDGRTALVDSPEQADFAVGDPEWRRVGRVDIVQGCTAPQPAKWTAREIADGYKGIRWVTQDGVFGRPTADDVHTYLANLDEPLTDAQALDMILAHAVPGKAVQP